MKKLVFSLVVALFVLNGCTTLKLNQALADANDPQVVKAYENKLNEIVKEIQSDPNYVRIPLNTKKDQDWFITQAFLFWDKKISKDEFLKRGEEKFPGYKSSFKYVADRLVKG
jgi:hypothetical protein